MKKSIWLTLPLKIFVIALLLSLFPLRSQAAPLTKLSWRAEYYDNDSLSGQPRITRFEARLGQDWGTGSPALEIPRDHFSARWTRTLHLEEGTYLFFLTVDDGARVWIDGRLIIDAWDIGRVEKQRARIRLDKTGDYELQVAYFENTGSASIDLEWIRLGGENDIVGAWNGEYFNNKNLSGSPVMTRQDSRISFDWNSGSPHPKVTRDNFSVRWTRSIYLKEGHYHFRVQHDDGMRIYIDGKIVYESWFDQEVTYQTGIVPIKEGYRTFVVEYYDHIGNAVVQLSFDEDPGDYGSDDPGPDGPGVIVDNISGRFKWTGPSGNRFVKSGGYGDNFYWTYNANNSTVNAGQWTPPLTSAGNYEIFAYISGDRATTTNARYRIYHYGRVIERKLNQSVYSNEFASLGIYYFDAGGNEFVTLQDATGEAAGSTAIAFDALRFIKR